MKRGKRTTPKKNITKKPAIVTPANPVNPGNPALPIHLEEAYRRGYEEGYARGVESVRSGNMFM